MLKNDKLDALIMLSGDVLIAKNVDLYRNAGVPILKRPRSLDKKVQKSINKERRMQEFGAFYKYGRRVAAALLIACSISFAAVMSVKAVRTTLWNMIVEFFDEYLSVSFITETPPPQSIEETKGLFYDVTNQCTVRLGAKTELKCSLIRKNFSMRKKRGSTIRIQIL